MLTDTRSLKLAQSKTTRAIFFFFQIILFPTLPAAALVQRFEGQGGTWKKGKKIANCTKPFPGKAQALGWSGHVAALPPTPWSSGFAGRGTDGDSSHSP